MLCRWANPNCQDLRQFYLMVPHTSNLSCRTVIFPSFPCGCCPVSNAWGGCLFAEYSFVIAIISDFFHSLSCTFHSTPSPLALHGSSLPLRGLCFLSAALRWLSVDPPLALHVLCFLSAGLRWLCVDLPLARRGLSVSLVSTCGVPFAGRR